jgi:tripartite-type tricarboxylate transporter receptor subunit TctC
MFDSITVTKAQMEAGKLRALGVTSLKPYKLLPGVPPVADMPIVALPLVVPFSVREPGVPAIPSEGVAEHVHEEVYKRI